jgi:hypothetical protein
MQVFAKSINFNDAADITLHLFCPVGSPERQDPKAKRRQQVPSELEILHGRGRQAKAVNIF